MRALRQRERRTLAATASVVLALLIGVRAQAQRPPPIPPTTAPATQPEPERVELVIAGETFRLELALDPVARARGLMGRTELEPDGGMIFVFPVLKIRTFWMYDCAIDVDVVFLDEERRIIAAHEMKTPRAPRHGESWRAYRARLPRYSSRRPARYAVELPAGSIRRLGLRAGDVVEVDPELRDRAR